MCKIALLNLATGNQLRLSLVSDAQMALGASWKSFMGLLGGRPACCLACRKAGMKGGGELQGSKSAKCLEKASLSLYCGCG